MSSRIWNRHKQNSVLIKGASFVQNKRILGYRNCLWRYISLRFFFSSWSNRMSLKIKSLVWRWPVAKLARGFLSKQGKPSVIMRPGIPLAFAVCLLQHFHPTRGNFILPSIRCLFSRSSSKLTIDIQAVRRQFT